MSRTSRLITLGIIGGGGAAAPFTPASISGLVLWLNPASPLYQDAARTTPVTADADPIGSWTDMSGNNNHAQSSLTARPLYKTAIQNGLSIARFDGTNDSVLVPSLTLPTDITVVTVAKFTNAKPLFIEQGVNSTTNDGFYFYGSTSNTTNIRRTTVRQYNTGPNWMGAAWCVPVAIYSGTGASRVYLSGATVSVAAGTINSIAGNVSAQLNIASRNQASVFGDGDLAELLIYNTPISSADRLVLQTYLGTKYNIAIS